MSVHVLYEMPYVERIDLVGKPTAALLRWGHAVGSAAWGFEHQCQSWPDPQEPDGVVRKLVAPRLTNHTISHTESGITVRPSIACPDCGLHGWITDSRWSDA